MGGCLAKRACASRTPPAPHISGGGVQWIRSAPSTHPIFPLIGSTFPDNKLLLAAGGVPAVVLMVT